MAWLDMIPAALTLAGSFMSAKGSYAAGQASRDAAASAKAAADFQSAQLNQNAGQALAAAQREQFEQERQTRLVAGRALAVAAASGASASDPTVMTLISRTAAEGAYRGAIDIYQGEERARQMRMAAAAKRFEGDLGITSGDSRAKAYGLQGASALLSGAGSLFAKYGMGGPAAKTTVSSVDSYGINWDNV